MASKDFDKSCYTALLGLAESYRTVSNIRHCIHCLKAVFNLNPPPAIEARTHLQLGNIMLSHTKNNDLVRQHLEIAVSMITLIRMIV